MQEDVDCRRSCGVQPARDELQGDFGLAQFICSGAEAHISRGSMPLHGHRVSIHGCEADLDKVVCKDICDVGQVSCSLRLAVHVGEPSLRRCMGNQSHDIITDAQQMHNRCIPDA